MTQTTSKRRRRQFLGRHRPGKRFTLTHSIATPQQHARRQALPWFVIAGCFAGVGLAMVIIALLVADERQPLLTETFLPMGVMLLAVSTAPGILGVVRLLAMPPVRAAQHCGLCQFYRPNDTTYDRGVCAIDSAYHLTTRLESCERFSYSERSMVRDRLSEAPHILGSPSRPNHDA